MKILVAEDDESTRFLICSLLNIWGYEAVAAKDGKEAWTLMKAANPPMLLILDWMMPGINGIELCKLAKAIPSVVKPYIIFLTCRSQVEDIVTALQGGADDYMTKPFNTEEFRARLQVGLRILGLQVELKRERDRAKLYLDKAGVMLVVLNEAEEITLINRKGLEILGYSHADVIGQNWFIKVLNPEDRKLARKLFRQVISRQFSTHDPILQTIVTKSGDEKLLEMHCTMLGDKTNDNVEVLFSGTDVTEKEKAGEALRKSEESYRGLFDSMVSRGTVLSTYKNIKKT